ncbi:MAG: 50S ribosomal protein L15 [Bacteroidetes bacterium]|nr:50S ribosomal protein L15 [Bacteroidota bacterium]MBX7127982.1 50S ribosomal protein L15 [Flavobacteriales bacterium]MCC6654222.1 50S ribosomal protein L15 [Flavobacteriales bacterium]HMU14940.1 50S ribosomal protein L15 [Flavobacteriales bacterium]HMZ48917.1 50S ribosomal protein L15 [Flavobacteriales bacterium]
MDLSQLKPAEGATKKNKRLGRGQGSGRGGTSTKGHKGQKAISGYNHKRGFEGGQTTMSRRLPKFGFTNPTRVEYKGINLDAVQALADKNKGVVDIAALRANGLIGKNDLVKILGRGELTGAIDVKANAFSASAKAAIEAKGGKVEIVNR